jgi:hypothetical protein
LSVRPLGRGRTLGFDSSFWFSLNKVATMKSHFRFPLASLLVVATGLGIGTQALAQTDRLRSWNEGPPKQAIIKFAGYIAVGAEPLEKTKNILAAQLRDQGYECDQPKSAERDIQASKPDEEV